MCSYITGEEEIAKEYKDRDKKRVVWYKESYDSHMEVKHYDIKDNRDKVGKAIKTPQLIRKEARGVQHFYFIRENRQGKKLYMKVVVCYNASPAHVKTAFSTSDIKGASIC